MANILVVENDKSSIFVISSIVNSMGHMAIKAKNGRMAWEFLQENHKIVDLIITDLKMPELTGEELIARIRENNEMTKIPIIVQSAYLGVRGSVELLDKGVNEIIPKPIDGDTLKEYIRQHVS